MTTSGVRTTSSTWSTTHEPMYVHITPCADAKIFRMPQTKTKALAGGYLIGDNVQSMINHKEIQKGGIGTVVGACTSDAKDGDDRVCVDWGEGKIRCNFLIAQLQHKESLTSMRFVHVGKKEMANLVPPTIHEYGEESMQESAQESEGSTTGGSGESQRDSSPPHSNSTGSNHGNNSAEVNGSGYSTSNYGSGYSEMSGSAGQGLRACAQGTHGSESDCDLRGQQKGDRIRSRRPHRQRHEILQGPRTTLTITGLPSYFTRKMLMVLLDQEGFERCYDLLYLPMDFEKKHSLGYALINLTSIDVAERCFARFSTYPVTVAWSSSLQGLIPCVEKYRNSPIMHPTVEDELKPALFVEGIRAPFPRPTVDIPAPVLKKIEQAC